VANARVAAQHEAVVVGRVAIATDKGAVANASGHVPDLLSPNHARANRANRNHVVNEAALGVAMVKLYNVTPVVTTSSSMTEFFTGPNKIIHGDNMAILTEVPDESVTMIYVDPPFNTGRTQSRASMTTVRVADGKGDRVGFGG